MKGRKQLRREPTRHQPHRAVRDTGKLRQVEAGDITASPPPPAGVRKAEGKPRGTAAVRRKKFEKALVKKVDARNSQVAWAEQAHLFGLGDASPPSSPTSTRPSKPKVEGRRKAKGKKYMDDILSVEENAEDELKRGERWIPDFAHRRRPNHQPSGVPFSLWMAYKHLDDYIYRHSLSKEDLEALPLLDDVHEYQNSDGRIPRPITPPGYRWDENLELIPDETLKSSLL
ncbi:hypothetical protein F4823DRAFT_618777 [Ustulina deusta]|nr:hypothetical protein F4823DRAFT_618777 [Ustulina deusta]